jgi:hypothetical protein
MLTVDADLLGGCYWVLKMAKTSVVTVLCDGSAIGYLVPIKAASRNADALGFDYE